MVVRQPDGSIEFKASESMMHPVVALGGRRNAFGGIFYVEKLAGWRVATLIIKRLVGDWLKA